jgi:hypothetical protein
MQLRDQHISRSSLLACGSLILGAAFATATLGFGIGAWLLLTGAFCALIMGSMIWMMIAMGSHAKHRR